jgi:hypothetical protein
MGDGEERRMSLKGGRRGVSRRALRWGLGIGIVAGLTLEMMVGVAASGEIVGVDPAAEGDAKPEPEGGLGGYGEQRVESELSIHVPAGKEEAVWAYLARVYGGDEDSAARGDGAPAGWPAGVQAPDIQARLSHERFIDRYYDTPDLKFLGMNSGVRFRSRDIPDAPDDPKDDRQLIQVKLTTAGDTVKRGEYKFPVKRTVNPEVRDGGPILNLIRKQKHRDAFVALMQELGVKPDSLRQVVRLSQNRRRVYFSDAKGPLATVTLDEVKTRRWWARAGWTELELELGEVRYTKASAEERRQMEALRAGIRADLFRQFPDLVEDNMPKYTEAFALLEAKLPVLRPVTALRGTAGHLLIPIATAGVLGAAGIFLVRRRRRGDGQPPRRTLTARPA